MVEIIRALCESNGLTLSKLEKECGISQSTIYKWDKSTPSADRLKAVADYFDVSMEYLMTGEEKQPSVLGGLSTDELNLIEAVRSLPDDERQSAISLLLRAAKHNP